MLKRSLQNGEFNDEKEFSISRYLGESVVDPSDGKLQKWVLGKFMTKTQFTDIAQVDSIYRATAIEVLKIAESENYTMSDLEKASLNFMKTMQYGDRIDPAHFFAKHEPEKFYPYSWLKYQVNEGKTSYSDWDGYMLPDFKKVMWRKHDGKILEIGRIVNIAGKPVKQTLQLESGTKQERDGQGSKDSVETKETSKNDDLLSSTVLENAKLNLKLLENKDTIAELTKKVETLQNDKDSFSTLQENYLSTCNNQLKEIQEQQQYIESLQDFIEQNGMKEIFIKQMKVENEGN